MFFRLRTTMLDLKKRLTKSPPDLPHWLHVDSGAIEGMTATLDYWSKLHETKTTARLLRDHVSKPPSKTDYSMLNSPNIAPEYREMMKNNLADKRLQVGAMLDTMDDSQMRQIGLIQPGQSPAQARRALATRREEIIDMLMEHKLNGSVQSKMDFEQEWYGITKTFVPPAELWGQHPGWDKYRQFKQGKASISEQAAKAVSGGF